MIEAAIAFLLDTQNSDGGWGAIKGRRSNTEATSLAVLALEALKRSSTSTSIEGGVSWLIARQNADGSWPFNDISKDGSWSTGIAILTLSLRPEYRSRVTKAAKWALGHEGIGLGWFSSLLLALFPQKLPIHLNAGLKGWPWTAGSFSWVEPTSYFLIALKKLKLYLGGTNADDRIHQGEMMIYDRMCEAGGWNYGNSKVLGESLWPYADLTALALIALQDHRDREANRRSLEILQKMARETRSGFALSWSTICFALYGYDVASWKKLLVESFEKTSFLGETKILALSLLALHDGARFFRLGST